MRGRMIGGGGVARGIRASAGAFLLVVGEVFLTSLFVVGAAVGLTSICVVLAVVFEVMRG